MKHKFVTLFVLVAVLLMGLSVASVSASAPGSVALCNPGGQEVNVPAAQVEAILTGMPGNQWTYPPCTPDDDDDGDDEVCEWNENIPADDENCVDPGDDEDEVCEWDETLPADSDLCVDPGDDDDDDDNDDPVVVDPGTISTSEPVQPAALQITVWPDNNGQTDNLSGVTWTIDGSPIYSDADGDNAFDLGEEIVTAIEYRDRPVCGDNGPVVLNQAMSRLVLSVTVDEVGDLDAYLSRFEAHINGQPVTWGWYDIGGEFAACVHPFDGAVQHRMGE